MDISPSETPKHETVMDVTEEQIARVYAQAFLGVAIKAGDVEPLVDQLESLVQHLLDKFPQLEEVLRSELISTEDKAGIFDRVLGGQAAPQLLHFLKVLAVHRRLGLLRSIARVLGRLYVEHRGQVEVHVRVACELDESLQHEIYTHLQQTLNKEPLLRVTVDPSLLAGITIRVGDRVYDGSVKTRLDMARKSMIERAVERIETQPERFLGA